MIDAHEMKEHVLTQDDETKEEKSDEHHENK